MSGQYTQDVREKNTVGTKNCRYCCCRNFVYNSRWYIFLCDLISAVYSVAVHCLAVHITIQKNIIIIKYSFCDFFCSVCSHSIYEQWREIISFYNQTRHDFYIKPNFFKLIYKADLTIRHKFHST